MSRQAGFSLAELMIVTALLAGVTGTLAAVGQSIHRADRITARYVEDVTGLRRAVRVVERDARAGRMDGYALDDAGVLRRDGVVIARNIAVFDVARTGDRIDVRIGLGRRSDVPAARRPVIGFSVRARGPR